MDGEGLPTGLASSGDQTIEAEVTEADPANPELAIDRAGPPAQLTAAFATAAELGLPVRLLNLGLARHQSSSSF